MNTKTQTVNNKLKERDNKKSFSGTAIFYQNRLSGNLGKHSAQSTSGQAIPKIVTVAEERSRYLNKPL